MHQLVSYNESLTTGHDNNQRYGDLAMRQIIIPPA
jgi:hypothetical protein